MELPQGSHLNANQLNESTTFDSQYITTSTTTAYDRIGQVSETINELGLVTQYTYDSRGLQIETRSQSFSDTGDVVWKVTRNAYDSRGNLIASTGSYVDGETRDVRGSQYEYDGDSRTRLVRSVTDLDIDVVYDAASGIAVGTVITNVGDVISETSSLYDSAGRIVETVNVDQLRSETTYDAVGDVIRTRRQVPDESGDLVWMVSHTVYDDFGRAVLNTDWTAESSGKRRLWHRL